MTAFTQWQPFETWIDGQKTEGQCKLTLHQEYIDIGPSHSSEPDPSWQFTDAAGHFHAFDSKGKTPTLSEHRETYWCSDCRDDHEDITLHCSVCNEGVEPRYERVRTSNQTIPGERHWELIVPVEVLPIRKEVSVRVRTTGDLDMFGVMTSQSIRTISTAGNEVATAETVLTGWLEIRLRGKS